MRNKKGLRCFLRMAVARTTTWKKERTPSSRIQEQKIAVSFDGPVIELTSGIAPRLKLRLGDDRYNRRSIRRPNALVNDLLGKSGSKTSHRESRTTSPRGFRKCRLNNHNCRPVGTYRRGDVGAKRLRATRRSVRRSPFSYRRLCSKKGCPHRARRSPAMLAAAEKVGICWCPPPLTAAGYAVN